MSSATSHFNNAQLSIAAYADLIAGDTLVLANRNSLLDPQKSGMSSTQLSEFATRYPSVVTFFSDPDTGFQVAILKDTANDVPGNMTIAFRGTAGAEDLQDGVNIVGSGAAYGQIVAMVNWWSRASANPGQMVNQFRLAEVPNHLVPSGAVVLRPGTFPDTSYVLDVAPQAAAFSDERNISQRLANEDTNAKVDLTGHSLGGHLALAFSSLFDSVTGQVTVFNAPGFKTETQAFFAKLGGSIPTNANGNVFNVAADEALVGTSPFNFVTRMHSQPGTLVDIAIEKQSNSDEPSPFLPQRNPGRTGATH